VKKIGTWVGAATLALLLAGCDVSTGEACSQEGGKATNKDGTTYTCETLINVDGTRGNRVWRPDAPLKPGRS
jgi:hypothetical protein